MSCYPGGPLRCHDSLIDGSKTTVANCGKMLMNAMSQYDVIE